MYIVGGGSVKFYVVVKRAVLVDDTVYPGDNDTVVKLAEHYLACLGFLCGRAFSYHRIVLADGGLHIHRLGLIYYMTEYGGRCPRIAECEIKKEHTCDEQYEYRYYNALNDRKDL